MYSIDSLNPVGGMSGHSFLIHLHPTFREAVLKSDHIDQDGVDRVLKTYGPEWMVKCGFTHYFDPENCGWERKEYYIPSDATRLSEMIRVSWGEWGPEHICVPGNACGLDIACSFGTLWEGGASLVPHNIDSWNQKCLLLVIFTWFAHSVFLHQSVADRG